MLTMPAKHKGHIAGHINDRRASAHGHALAASAQGHISAKTNGNHISAQGNNIPQVQRVDYAPTSQLFQRRRRAASIVMAPYLTAFDRDRNDKLKRQTLSIIKMPPEDEWVKASILQKRVVTSDIFWQEKKLVSH